MNDELADGGRLLDGEDLLCALCALCGLGEKSSLNGRVSNRQGESSHKAHKGHKDHNRRRGWLSAFTLRHLFFNSPAEVVSVLARFSQTSE